MESDTISIGTLGKKPSPVLGPPESPKMVGRRNTAALPDLITVRKRCAWVVRSPLIHGTAGMANRRYGVGRTLNCVRNMQ